MSDESRKDRVARWQKRIEEAPDSAAAHYNLGLAHTERGRMVEAEKAFRRAVELDPELVQAWVNLGGALLMKWDFQGSLEANQEAVRRNDTLAEAHFNMGLAHLYLKHADELVQCNRRVLELDALVASVTELGRVVNVPTPTLDTVLALVRLKVSADG